MKKLKNYILKEIQQRIKQNKIALNLEQRNCWINKMQSFKM